MKKEWKPMNDATNSTSSNGSWIDSFDSFDSKKFKVFFRLPDVTAAPLIKMRGHNIYQYHFLIYIISNGFFVCPKIRQITITSNHSHFHNLCTTKQQSTHSK
jgi:hypothetical protein